MHPYIVLQLQQRSLGVDKVDAQQMHLGVWFQSKKLDRSIYTVSMNH